jgi:DNA-binding transcriptional MerR regulator
MSVDGMRVDGMTVDDVGDGGSSMSIGQVAERTGMSVHALRSYAREGILVNPVGRAPGGQRVYTEGDVEWLTLCLILRGSGMPLPEIRRYTVLVRDGDGNEPERLALLREHEERVIAEIGQLTRCLDLIRFKVGVYEDLLAGDTAEHDCSSQTAAAAGAITSR